MKRFLVTCICLLSISCTFSQTKENKIGITIGGGSQKYSGDLGNGFTLRNRVWRGSVALNVNYYLTKSFDIGLHYSIGDFGYCQPHDMTVIAVVDEDQCDGCVDRIGLGNLSSRMYMGGVLVKYKFNNGYLLNENCRIKPYIYSGLSINTLDDRMKMKCVSEGNYLSINSGVGVRLYLNNRVNIGYNMNFGYFASDELDFLSSGNNDMFLQNTFSLGIDL
jgi:hypothetical protein